MTAENNQTTAEAMTQTEASLTSPEAPPETTPTPIPTTAETLEPVMTLSEAWKPFVKFHLEGERKCGPATLVSYRKDFERVEAFLSGNKRVDKITQRNVRDFAKSPHLLHKDMDPDKKRCAEPTVKKTLRLFKMFLAWLETNGYINKAPIPADLAMGSKSNKEKKEAEKKQAKARAEKEKAAKAAKEKAAKEKAAKAKQEKPRKAQAESNTAMTPGLADQPQTAQADA